MNIWNITIIKEVIVLFQFGLLWDYYGSDGTDQSWLLLPHVFYLFRIFGGFCLRPIGVSLRKSQHFIYLKCACWNHLLQKTSKSTIQVFGGWILSKWQNIFGGSQKTFESAVCAKCEHPTTPQKLRINWADAYLMSQQFSHGNHSVAEFARQHGIVAVVSGDADLWVFSADCA